LGWTWNAITEVSLTSEHRENNLEKLGELVEKTLDWIYLLEAQPGYIRKALLAN
jgi:hypothetical protein